MVRRARDKRKRKAKRTRREPIEAWVRPEWYGLACHKEDCPCPPCVYKRMDRNVKTQPVSVRLPESAVELLKMRASEEGESLSGMLKNMVYEFLSLRGDPGRP